MSVTRFDVVHHPGFTTTPAERAKDPRRIKFNHQRHLARGLTPEKGGAPFTFAQIAPKDRTRYGSAPDQKLDSPVQLVCANCHQLDAMDDARAAQEHDRNRLLHRSPGDAMLPIVYAVQCAACHPLPFDGDFPDRQVRHGLAPAQVVRELRQFYAAQAVNDDPTLLRRSVPPRPLPGTSPTSGQVRVAEGIEEKVLTAANRLFGAGPDEAMHGQQMLPQVRRGCVECHNLKASVQPLVRPQDVATTAIEAVMMTRVWFESADFSHMAHRALDCSACHAGVRNSPENGDRPLLPDIAVCTTCHSTQGGGLSGRGAGASTACSACHRYHDADQPRRGLGAAARRAATQLSIEKFGAGGGPISQP
jgi:hypothetical protein